MLCMASNPDFSAAAVGQLRSIGRFAMESGPRIRDLLALRVVLLSTHDCARPSILSLPDRGAAGGRSSGDRRCRVTVGCRLLPIVSHSRTNTTTVYTPQNLSDACGAAVRPTSHRSRKVRCV